MEGKIELRHYANDMDRTWTLEAGCDEPNATITYMNIEEGYDFLIVKGEKYYGTDRKMPISVCL